MSSRNQQDAFIDDSDESCPLCVEEFDLSDKSFRPCPCGYQVCQFCYNNIKLHMNGLCPACRRPYDDQSVEWKSVSQEEQKAETELQKRKKQLAKKKESEQRQVETSNRKNLAGIRVVQKNLVYVVGLSQKNSEEEFLRTLRGPAYFGQYGKIIKIVVSKAKEGHNGSSSIGVYVTFENREDAAKCIAAVDGSMNVDRPLRAQYGTTKYCSAFLRNEPCTNRNCTFLHETGEDNDSFSRQDLSSMNALSTQRPAQQASSSKPHQQPQPPPQQAPQSISAATPAGSSHIVKDEAMSRSDGGDGSALPSSASWAAKNTYNESRRSSKPASVAASSPRPIASTLTQTIETRHIPSEVQEIAEVSSVSPQPLEPTESRTSPDPPHPLDSILKILKNSSFKFTFDRSIYSEEDLRDIDSYPPLFDAHGGLVRYRMAKEQEEERQKEEEERNALGAIAAADEDEAPASGSLQLGGEPETQEEPHDSTGRISAQQRGAIQPPFASSTNFPFGNSSFNASNAGNLTQTLTPQQQHQIVLLRGHSSHQSPVSTGQPQQGYTSNTSLHHHQQSNPFQMQNQGQSFGTAQGHARQASRFTFANDSASASTAVKPVANPQLMAQQSAMMPTTTQGKPFHNQTMQQPNIHGSQFYSGVQGPPPGLKSSGTPPISGGGMFGQGHGFASAMGGSAGFTNNTGSKNSNEELMRELLRTRNGSINGQGHDIGKREFKFPFSQQPMTSDAPASSLASSFYGPQLSTYHGHQDHNLQKKQKKTGKKHRHANTSSSGGGGIVDLADPSILQARMHHGAAGQGPFGTQGQGTLLEDIEESIGTQAASSFSRQKDVEASTTSSVNKQATKKPPIKISDTKDPPTPGLPLPQDFPPLAAPAPPPQTPTRLQRKATSSDTTIKPVVPVLPSSSSARVLAAAKEPQSQSVGTSLPAEQSVKAITEADHGPRPAVGKGSKTIDLNDSMKSNEPGKLPASPANINKKQRPSKLDIAATKDASKKGTTSLQAAMEAKKGTEGPEHMDPVSALDRSQPGSPATAASQSSTPSAVRQNRPRTIRIPAASKVDAQPASPGIFSLPSASKQASPLHRSGTPMSERISDNASFTSTSMSRANSPPPSKVGSAPVRQVTKSQQKKERQARAKHAEGAAPVDEPVPKPQEVQEPVVGRRRKAKKEKTPGTSDSTPTATRPTSPALKEETIEEKSASTPLPTPLAKDFKKGTQKPSTDTRESDTPISPTNPANSDQQKNSLTAASIFASLQKAGEVSASATDLFKNIPGLNHRFEAIEPDLAPNNSFTLPEGQKRQLELGDPIAVEKGPNHHMILFPDRRVLPGFTSAQAARYLELRKCPLFNGDTPSHQALDALIPAPPPRTIAAAPSSSPLDPSAPSKKLVNPFAPPPMTNATGALASQQYGLSVSDGGIGIAAEDGLVQKMALVGMMGVGEAEQALLGSRKETEMLEKKLNAVLKKNRRLLFGSAH